MTALLDAALARLDLKIGQKMAAHDTPGLSLVITDRAETLAVRCYGKRDLAANADVTPDTVFEIGSVGKSFTAIALLQLQERGLVDLSAPVTDYLPWFSVRSDYQPITITHLLSHTGGIIGGSDMAYDGRFESWYLRETEVSGPPGERFHYSNVGYKTLGYLIEAITERSYGNIVRERILTPLGMDATVVPITNADRPRMAIGYRALHDDRPRPKGAPLAPATWIETATADGCLASTPEDMAHVPQDVAGSRPGSIGSDHHGQELRCDDDTSGAAIRSPGRRRLRPWDVQLRCRWTPAVRPWRRHNRLLTVP